MDAMSFIFRAYHAMARQRGMSTKTGLPTAATYVFVNMLRKCAKISPRIPGRRFRRCRATFRDQEAEAITKVRKFDIKPRLSRKSNTTATRPPQRDARGVGTTTTVHRRA